MTPARWNEIIATAAATAIDDCGMGREVGEDGGPDTVPPTIQKVAERAATLAAEWICEDLANEDDGEEAANP